MRSGSGVTLQISLAPTDAPHARLVLPHQLRRLAAQVDEILLTVDLDRSHGRFGESWDQRLPDMQSLVDDLCRAHAHARVMIVDYSPEVHAAVSAVFFAGRPVPRKDWRGGPFYSYFFGLYAARHPYVFHLDSDIMLGGGSGTWVAEALRLLADRPDVLVVGPLPGPPTADGSIRPQMEVPEPFSSPAFRFPDFSTRLFVLDRDRFASSVTQLPVTRPAPHRARHAEKHGFPPYDLPEDILSRAMQDRSLSRIDFLGDAPGLWSLHPVVRPPRFYDQLPDLIHRVETDDIPDGQRGDYDLNDSMMGPDPEAAKSSWRRFLR